MDDEILNTVHSMFGPNVKVVDCEKSSTLQQEETLFINGVPIKLDGMPNSEAVAIKAALLGGQMPSVDLLNQLLYQAGLLRQPIELETSLSVKSSVMKLENVSVSQRGQMLDNRICETKEDHVYESKSIEYIEPVLQKQMKDFKIAGSTSKENKLQAPKDKSPAKLRFEEPPHTAGQPPPVAKSSTFTCATSSTTNLKSNVNSRGAEFKAKSEDSVNDNQYFENQPLLLASTTSSNCSTNECRSNVGNSNVSLASSSATFVTPTVPMHSISIVSKASNDEKSSLSCDSGHDGIFHSVSQNTGYTPWTHKGASVTGNSFSSSYDILSSSDDIEAKHLHNSSFSSSINEKIKEVPEKWEYRRPQTIFPLLAYQSCVDEHRVLRFCNGILMSGSLDALITHLVPKADYYPDKDFTFTMLLAIRLLGMQPHELLKKIREILQQQQGVALFSSKAKVARNLLEILSFWIDNFPYDFVAENLMQESRLLIDKCLEIDKSVASEVSIVLEKLNHQLFEISNYEEQVKKSAIQMVLRRSSDSDGTIYKRVSDTGSNNKSYELMRSESQPSSKKIKSTSSGNCLGGGGHMKNNENILDICESPIELAHQLTAIELEFLSHIGAEELFKAFSKKMQTYMLNELQQKSKLQSKCKSVLKKSSEQKYEDLIGDDDDDEVGAQGNDIKNSHNLEGYIKWSNRLSYFTATQIVRLQKKRQRVQMIEFWIETARECFNTGNFNSLMAILAGLNLSPVTRLKKTWSKVKSAKFSVLENQMNPSLNFSSYRSTMKAAVWRCEDESIENKSIVIPFFTLFLKDLSILNEGNPIKLPNQHINYEKCFNIAKQAQDFNKWKRASCPYERLPNVITFLRTAEVYNEKALSMASFAWEQPENEEEKGHYKMLKSATK